MERTCPTPCSRNASSRPSWLSLLATLLLLVGAPLCSYAGLSGTYTVGGSGDDYSTIASAINALDQNGVSGPVVFVISGGTYTSPSGGFRLGDVSGMSATNTVTFKPASNATVTIQGDDSYDAIFRIYGGHHFIIDGSNQAGGTSRDMTIINTNTNYGTAVWMDYNADLNEVRNCNLMSNSAYYSNSSGGSTVLIGRNSYTTNGGNDSNIVRNCRIGDPDGTYRAGVAVYLYGGSSSSSYRNYGNQILNNEIVNFGKMYGTSYYQGYSYGIYLYYYNDGTVIRGNDIHITEPIEYYYVYGMYIYEYNGYTRNTVIDANRIYDLESNYSYSYLYYIRFYNYYGSNTTAYITNNMITMKANANSYCYGIYAYPYRSSSTMELNIANNSIYAGGSNATRSTYMLYVYGRYGTGTVNHYNNIYYSERTANTTCYGMYLYYISNWNSDYNLIDVRANSRWYTAYYYNSGGGTYSTLAAYQNAVGEDEHSIEGNPQFINPDEGNLHIDEEKPAALESRGTVLDDVTTDIDGDTRSTFAPDIGADEGNFNGGGISVVSPNGGEEITTDYLMTVRYSTNRPLGVKIDLSLDGGATWSNYGTVDPTNAGNNEFTFTSPDVVTDNALVRVISSYNSHEADTSDRPFRLVRPIVSLLKPNGSEIWVPTDTNRIQWTTQYLPPTMTIRLDYSTDGGSSWLPIETDISSPNLPAENTYNWIIPNTPSEQAIVRAKIEGLTISDVSDQQFIIRPQPVVELLSPSDGDVLYSGEKQTIEWNTVTTDYVRIGYSTDDGSTWTTLVNRVPAYIGQYDWTIPEGMNTEALVRVVNVERPRFRDRNEEEITILTSDIAVLSPNGNETFELNQQIDVNWLSANAKTLRLDYSADNGQNWTPVASDLDASAGHYAFTPPQIPTKLARVRLTDVDREDVSDVSDRPFEILGSKSIIVLAPGSGDQLLRGSSTMIMWDAPRVNNINIYYSSNGGTSWSTIASNIQTGTGLYTWNVPNTLTNDGRIRLQEVGGNIVGESGTFAVVDEVVSSLRLVQPNGGEEYTEGDPVRISWTSSDDVLKVALSYSTDAGASWMLIAKDIPAAVGIYDWTAPSDPSDQYMVKVETAGVNDVSDATFTVMRKLFPSITVVSPNGGETFTEEDNVTITWTSTDVTGTVMLSYSMDEGTTMKEIATVAVSPGSYDWTIPAEAIGSQVWLSIAATDGSASDMSDDPFMVDEKVLEPIRVVSPNLGTETWAEATMQDITWESPEDVSQVDLHYSTDGGQSWMFIASQSSAPGMNSYQWTIPQVVPMSSNSLVRVRATSDTTRMDVSDNPFTLAPDAALSVSSGAVTGNNGMSVLGIYPNPFAATAELRWLQPSGGNVSVRLYDGAGRLVREIEAGRFEAGERHLTLNSDALASGLYYYELRSGLASARGMLMIAR